MSVLDTFYLLFKSDTSGLKKGADEALKIVHNLKGLLTAAIPTGFSLFALQGAIDFNVELAKSSRLLGVSANDLKAWGNAVELAGGDADQFQNTLSSLATRFGTSSETILKILPRYADALSRLSPQRAQQIGKNVFGLDEGTILLLQRGRREVENMIGSQKSLNVITKQNAEQFLLYREQTVKMKQAFQALFTTLAIEALPTLTQLFDSMRQGIGFFTQHKDFVIGGLYGIGAAIAFIAARFALLNTATFFWRAALVLLAVAIALVYDDIRVFLKDGDSMIGYLSEKLPNAAAVATEAFTLLSETINGIFEPLNTLEKRLQRYFNKTFKIGIDFSQSTLTAEQVGIAKAQALANITNNNNAKKIEIHNIEVHTQATDAQGLANTLMSAFNSSYAQTINYFADPVVS